MPFHHSPGLQLLSCIAKYYSISCDLTTVFIVLLCLYTKNQRRKKMSEPIIYALGIGFLALALGSFLGYLFFGGRFWANFVKKQIEKKYGEFTAICVRWQPVADPNIYYQDVVFSWTDVLLTTGRPIYLHLPGSAVSRELLSAIMLGSQQYLPMNMDLKAPRPRLWVTKWPAMDDKFGVLTLHVTLSDLIGEDGRMALQIPMLPTSGPSVMLERPMIAKM
jgi:hypothetical protein